MTNNTRTEKDSMGTVEVPANVLWGAQTERSLRNFSIADDIMPNEIIHALALIKESAAIVNESFGLLDLYKKDLRFSSVSPLALLGKGPTNAT